MKACPWQDYHIYTAAKGLEYITATQTHLGRHGLLHKGARSHDPVSAVDQTSNFLVGFERVGRHSVGSSAELPWSARACRVALALGYRDRNVGVHAAEALHCM